MLIFVHSSGRAGTLPTYDALMRSRYRDDVRLVVQGKEVETYKQAHPDAEIIVLPPEVTMLSPTRQWLLENSETKKFVLVDDDLTFSKRRSDDRTKFQSATNADITAMLKAMERQLDKYAHVGVLAREGGNRITDTYTECIRMMRILGYRQDIVQHVGARFDRIMTKQDFDMTLQLLRAGHPNRVLCNWVHNQAGSNAAGGCSAYRTPEVMDRSAHKLAKLHPGYVKVVEKETKGAWGGGVRMDVLVQWKKAFKEAKK